jgi:hypothetical protein
MVGRELVDQPAPGGAICAMSAAAPVRPRGDGEREARHQRDRHRCLLVQRARPPAAPRLNPPPVMGAAFETTEGEDPGRTSTRRG